MPVAERAGLREELLRPLRGQLRHAYAVGLVASVLLADRRPAQDLTARGSPSGPPRGADQASTASGSAGGTAARIRTSSRPASYDASTCSGLTPCGSANSRRNAP